MLSLISTEACAWSGTWTLRTVGDPEGLTKEVCYLFSGLKLTQGITLLNEASCSVPCLSGHCAEVVPSSMCHFYPHSFAQNSVAQPQPSSWGFPDAVPGWAVISQR